jgi:hypothetical protein
MNSARKAVESAKTRLASGETPQEASVSTQKAAWENPGKRVTGGTPRSNKNGDLVSEVGGKVYYPV